MHASDGFSGLCTCIGSFSCAPVFWYSSQLIDKYGHGRCILVAEIVYLFRLVVISMIPYNWIYSKQLILFMHVFHGPSFALFWSASVDAVFKQSPKHLATSCMACMSMFHNVLGPCIGSLILGYVYAWLGGMTFGFYLLAICFQVWIVKQCLGKTQMLDRAMEDAESQQKDKDSSDSDEYDTDYDADRSNRNFSTLPFLGKDSDNTGHNGSAGHRKGY